MTLREERLGVWDALVAGHTVSEDRVREAILPAARETSEDEKLCSSLLWAAAKVSRSASPAMRRNLTAVLRYWFSQEGFIEQPPDLAPASLTSAGLDEVMGLGLSWPQAMESVAGNPKDYTALVRVTTLLRKECASAWREMFGTAIPRVFVEGGD